MGNRQRATGNGDKTPVGGFAGSLVSELMLRSLDRSFYSEITVGALTPRNCVESWVGVQPPD